MISLCMIITALVSGLALAKVSMECNLSGPTGAQQCFGVLGEPFMFHLPTNLTHIMLKMNETLNILNIRSNGVVHYNEKYINRSVFFPNGTFKLNNAQKTDSGNYKLQAYGSDGKLFYNINMNLEIQAPVSKPIVSQTCLSPEKMNVSCSAEGNGVEFILNLDGHLLMHTKDHSQFQSSSTVDTPSLDGSTENRHKSSVTIHLHGQLTGNLMCNVQNNFNTEETIIQLNSCKGSIPHSSFVAVALIASAITILLHVALFVGFKHFNKQTRPVTVSEDTAEDEIVYSDVRVKHTRKTRPTSEQNPS